MNPVDHPMGGGEGKSSGGRHPCTPWGMPTKGHKTRNNRAHRQVHRQAAREEVMARSLKKGPFVDPSLQRKVDASLAARLEAGDPHLVAALDDHARVRRAHVPRPQREAVRAGVRHREHGRPPARRVLAHAQVHRATRATKKVKLALAPSGRPDRVMKVSAFLKNYRVSPRKARLRRRPDPRQGRRGRARDPRPVAEALRAAAREARALGARQRGGEEQPRAARASTSTISSSARSPSTRARACGASARARRAAPTGSRSGPPTCASCSPRSDRGTEGTSVRIPARLALRLAVELVLGAALCGAAARGHRDPQVHQEEALPRRHLAAS